MHFFSSEHHHFDEIVNRLARMLIDAPVVDVGEWQAQRLTSMDQTAELQDVTLEVALPQTVKGMQRAFAPNLPWADEHFNERVSGQPLNPPPSHVRWPFARASNDEHREGEKFSHTYPERFWPKLADPSPNVVADKGRFGIRFQYGDLNDVIKLLRDRPTTRQAFLPIWFPEDGTASLAGKRVPCSLGYHFMIRDNQLSVRYYMRSCDFLRHFRDDVYFAARLALYVAESLGTEYPALDKLVMHISSLHIFAPADVQLLTYRLLKNRV